MADLTISRGDGITLVVTITSPADAQLADYACAFWASPDSPLVVLRTADLVITDDPDGDTVAIVVPGTTTAAWPAGRHSYELKFLAADGQPETIDVGSVVVRPSAIGAEVTL